MSAALAWTGAGSFEVTAGEPDLWERPVRRVDAARWAGVIGAVADLLEQRLTGAFSPGWGSSARREFDSSAAQRCPDGSLWGEWPYRLTWIGHAILIATVAEHCRAAALLLRCMPDTPLPLEAETRVVLEAASKAAWLTVPGLGGRARVARFEVLRRRSAGERDRLAGILGLAVDTQDPNGIAGIDHYAGVLGLQIDYGGKGGWSGLEGQRWAGATEQCAWLMQQTRKDPPRAVYSMLCGAQHSELWRLTQGYRPADGVPGWVPRPAEGFPRMSAMIALEAAVHTAASAFVILGHGAGLAQLRRLAGEARAAFSAL